MCPIIVKSLTVNMELIPMSSFSGLQTVTSTKSFFFNQCERCPCPTLRTARTFDSKDSGLINIGVKASMKERTGKNTRQKEINLT